MKLKITKGARQFGYLIWSSKTEAEMEKMLQKKDEIKVSLNSFDLGEKHIDHDSVIYDWRASQYKR